jgi:carbamoyl-phosphate synthase small subunit
MKIAKKALLLLEDGTLFEGSSFGALGSSGGELCFNTGMTGYQEIFTDPSYYGQVLIMNTAHVGNYGTKPEDVESETVKISGLICKNLSETFSRTQADASLQEYLTKHNIVGIHELDTRALVSHIRTKGAMNCIITTEVDDVSALSEQLKAIPSMVGLELSSKVSTLEPYTLGDENSDKRIAVLDFGVKRNILNCLTERGAYLKVFPHNTSFETCEAFAPHAYFISNGPGDPAVMQAAISTVQDILASEKPLFGICLGHQLLALASGASSYKMHHGHRGMNHPVKNLMTGKAEITTQNHGFAIDMDSIKQLPQLEITHVNLNDQSLEGMRIKGKKAFSVQYHPEAAPGPHDSRYLFDEFMSMI